MGFGQGEHAPYNPKFRNGVGSHDQPRVKRRPGPPDAHRAQRLGASLIIACLNGAETLDAALESLISQETGFPWEIIFADNGCTDNSVEIFQSWSRKRPDLSMRVLDCSAQRGKVYALNKAIATAGSDRLLFLDADDALAPGYLAAMHRALDDHPFVAARMEHQHLNTPVVVGMRAGGSAIQRSPLRLPHAPYCLHAGAATMGFHREVFDRLGGFDPEFVVLEDTDFCVRAFRIGIPLTFVPEALYHYRFRDDIDSVYRQSFNYSRYAALLRKRHGEAAPPITLHRWAMAGASVASLKTRQALTRRRRPDDALALGKVTNRLGWVLGDLEGARAFDTAPRPRPVPGAAKARTIGRKLRSRGLAGFYPSTTGAQTSERAMALTFDDGPDPEWTPRVLDMLAETGAKATFFVIGDQADRHPDLLARITAEGHEIGNHSWNHPSFPALSEAEIEAQITRTRDVLAPHVGSLLLRPPYGDQSLASWRIARRLGYRMVLWNRTALDWTWDSAEQITQRLTADAAPGAIVLLHDSLRTYDEASVRGRQRTIEGVRQAIAALPDYRFLTVSGLIATGRPLERCWLQPTDPNFQAALLHADLGGAEPDRNEVETT